MVVAMVAAVEMAAPPLQAAKMVAPLQLPTLRMIRKMIKSM